MLNHRQYTRRFLAGLSFSCAVFLAGCSDDTIAEPPLQSVDSSAKATDGATSSTTITTLFETETEAEQSKQEEPEEHEECDTDPASPEIHKAAEEANEQHPNQFGGWVLSGRTNFNSCSDLSYALLTQAEVGNAQFGTLILMFHKGEYIGVDSLYPQQAMEITPNDDGSFTVLYKDWEALDEAGAGNAESPNYNSTVTYYWDGDKVAHDGRIPNTSLTPQ